MGKAVLILGSPRDRDQAAKWVLTAPYGSLIEFRSGMRRSREQNDRQWWLLTLVANNLVWHGQKLSTDEWKDFFMHLYRREKWVPDEDGVMIPVGRNTSALNVQEHNEFQALIEAFCARQGVNIPELDEVTP